ncbi:MAG TPA: VCBS repeat-containing protein [Cyclobacteriaceae bacterium]|nr:VCBS repeat-containing protein [Cyclobacteriaceae bacterium]
MRLTPMSMVGGIAGVALAALIFYTSCESREHRKERIARMYCGQCHVFPEPELLDRKTWIESVLPLMAFHMGATNNSRVLLTIDPGDIDYVLSALPSRFIASDEEWQAIREYYFKHAPDSLTITHPVIDDTLSWFHASSLKNTFEPHVTFLRYDTVRRELYAGTRYQDFFTFDSRLERIDSIKLSSPPSWMEWDDGQVLLTTMGIMDPNDRPAGRVVSVKGNKEITLIDSIKRPVYFEHEDLNGDGVSDLVVCGFGNYTGHLSVYDGHNNAEHVLSATPGARKTIVRDVNRDGRPDILALFAQGDERIVSYTNRGNFSFDETILLRFSPVDGTSYFEIADFNGDGHFDILVTNGDNADYSPIIKPYHGVTIYENDGENVFTERWSFPMPGASMAMARDFDNDGDLDIAAISFFPDFQRTPDRSFLYFENNGAYDFKPHRLPAATLGRWLVMEAADYDNDGDIDLVLGANNFGGMGAGSDDYSYWNANRTALLFLENTSVTKRPDLSDQSDASADSSSPTGK